MVTPSAGGPAEKGGVHAGDLIVAVDGRPAQDVSLYDIGALLQGPDKSQVAMTCTSLCCIGHERGIEASGICRIRSCSLTVVSCADRGCLRQNAALGSLPHYEYDCRTAHHRQDIFKLHCLLHALQLCLHTT